MFDQQISIGLARGGGIGLADFIEKQLNARAESTADVIARRSAKVVGE
jgi:Rod binding domain-containing protein